jgi:hypothetical protein
VLASLIGAILSPIPAVIGVYIIGRPFYPLFIAAPFIICLFLLLLKGWRDIRAVIVMSIFSLAGAYLTALSCYAAMYARAWGMSFTQIPILTVWSLAQPNNMPPSASAYLYPLLFSATGVLVAWELLRGRKCG